MSKPFVRSALVALAIALPSAALAGEPCCPEAETGEARLASAVKKVTVPELAQLQKSKQVTVLDANGAETRAKYGTIPGAVLLSHFKKYDAKELPAAKDSKLVFYCANEKCPASHAAAERAVANGYTDVSVLPDGIMGWKGAGQPTASVPRS